MRTFALRITAAAVCAISAIIFTSSAAQAANVSFSENTTLSGNWDSFATVSALSASEADEVIVESATITVTVPSGSTFTLESSADITFSNTGNIRTTCGTRPRLSVAGAVTSLVITPTNSPCPAGSVTPQITNPPPGPATGITGTVSNLTIALSWTNPQDADLARCEIWRNAGGQTAIVGPRAILSPCATTFTDRSEIAASTTYLYQIVTIDQAGGRTPSQEVAVATGAPAPIEPPPLPPASKPVLTLTLKAAVLSSASAVASAASISSLALALAISVMMFGAFLIHTHTGSQRGAIGFFAIFPLLFASPQSSYMYLRRCGPDQCVGRHFSRHKFFKRLGRISLLMTLIAGLAKLLLLFVFASTVPYSQPLSAQNPSVKAGEQIRAAATLENTGPVSATNTLLRLPAPAGTTLTALKVDGAASLADPRAGVSLFEVKAGTKRTVEGTYTVLKPAEEIGVVTFSATATASELAETVKSNSVSFAVVVPLTPPEVVTPPSEEVPSPPEVTPPPPVPEVPAPEVAPEAPVFVPAPLGSSVPPPTPFPGITSGAGGGASAPSDLSAPAESSGGGALILEPSQIIISAQVDQGTLAQLVAYPAGEPAAGAALAAPLIPVSVQIIGKNTDLGNIAYFEPVIASKPLEARFTPSTPNWQYQTKVYLSAGVYHAAVRAVDSQGITKPDAAAVEFTVIPPACYDGADNDNDGLTDYLADPGCGSAADTDELEALAIVLAPIVSEQTQEAIAKTIVKLQTSKPYQALDKKVFNNPAIEEVNVKVAAPVVTVAVAANAALSTSAQFNALYALLQTFFTQPLLLLTRRRRKEWGMVYSSLTKLPVDLAFVRLFDERTGKLVQTRVTDAHGRYVFFADPGRYRLEAAKANFIFPSQILKGKTADLDFADLYHGETIRTENRRTSIAKVIPVDPTERVETPREVIARSRRRALHKTIAWSGPVFAMVSVAISPTLTTAALLGAHFALLALFKRLAEGAPRPHSWGTVTDARTGAPLPFAVARIFEPQFNKLLETQITDKYGRYAFLVGRGNFYVTVQKPGYASYTSETLDLSAPGAAEIIKRDVRLQAGSEVVEPLPSSPSLLIRNNRGNGGNGKRNGNNEARKHGNSNRSNNRHNGRIGRA